MSNRQDMELLLRTIERLELELAASILGRMAMGESVRGGLQLILTDLAACRLQRRLLSSRPWLRRPLPKLLAVELRATFLKLWLESLIEDLIKSDHEI